MTNTDLHTASLVSEEQSQDEKQSFVSVGQAWGMFQKVSQRSDPARYPSSVLTQPDVVVVRSADPELWLVLHVLVLRLRFLSVESRDFPGDFN